MRQAGSCPRGGFRKILFYFPLVITVLFCIMLPGSAGAVTVNLAWDASMPAPDGYRVFMRQDGQAYNYSSPAWQGNALTCSLNTLQNAKTYYFVARAFEGTTESGNSNEVAFTTPAANGAPVASAGDDLAVSAGARVTLDGSGSKDPDGSPLVYSWTQTSGPAVTLSSRTVASPVFTAPAVTTSTVMTFQLKVNDPQGLSASDMCQVTVLPVAPVDSDGDGISDVDETGRYGTNPNLMDTDGDGISDGDEIRTGTDPLVSGKPAESVKIWLEAEDGNIYTPMRIASHSAASEGTFIHVPNNAGSGGYALYKVQIPITGSYHIWGRILAPSTADNSFYIRMDSAARFAWHTPKCSTWTWALVGGADPMVYKLTAGQHTLRVQRREDGTRIDRILITDDAEYVPTGMGEGAASVATVVLEAEAGVLKAPMQVRSSTAASLGKYVEVPQGMGSYYNPSTSGGRATYSFSITESGTYRIWGRVIAQSSNDNSFFVAVDDTGYVRWDILVSNSWAWDLVSASGGADPRLFQLAAGSHTLYILQREDGTRLDKIIITKDAGYIPE